MRHLGGDGRPQLALPLGGVSTRLGTLGTRALVDLREETAAGPLHPGKPALLGAERHQDAGGHHGNPQGPLGGGPDRVPRARLRIRVVVDVAHGLGVLDGGQAKRRQLADRRGRQGPTRLSRGPRDRQARDLAHELGRRLLQVERQIDAGRARDSRPGPGVGDPACDELAPRGKHRGRGLRRPAATSDEARLQAMPLGGLRFHRVHPGREAVRPVRHPRAEAAEQPRPPVGLRIDVSLEHGLVLGGRRGKRLQLDGGTGLHDHRRSRVIVRQGLHVRRAAEGDRRGRGQPVLGLRPQSHRLVG
jgi:hypothetical protein